MRSTEQALSHHLLIKILMRRTPKADDGNRIAFGKKACHLLEQKFGTSWAWRRSPSPHMQNCMLVRSLHRSFSPLSAACRSLRAPAFHCIQSRPNCTAVHLLCMGMHSRTQMLLSHWACRERGLQTCFASATFDDLVDVHLLRIVDGSINVCSVHCL